MNIKLFILLAVSWIQFAWSQDICGTAVPPEFSAAGRRISEQKCREYNWERKKAEKCSEDTELNEYSYMGALGYSDDNKEWKFQCSGFLISPKFVVTTAHCLRNSHLKNGPEIVRFGNKNIKDNVPRIDAKILRTIPHPQYHLPTLNFDIGLIELENNLDFTRAVSPVCLWTDSETDTKQTGKVPGWAKAKGEDDDKRNSIRAMNAQTLDSKTCVPLMERFFNRRWPKLEDHQLCANESSTDVILCAGVSGSPIIVQVPLDGKSDDVMPYALGCSSIGVLNCKPGVSIYSRISSFVDWIESVVWSTSQPL